MPLIRLAVRISLAVVFLMGFVACGGSTPPPRAPSAVGSVARGHAAPTGGTSTSLSDSALEPAAVDASAAEDWPRAEALYRELSRRQPRNGGAKRGLGIALLRQGKDKPDKIDEAATVLDDSLRLADDVRTRLALASAFTALGRFPSALPHLRKAVQMAPRDPAVWTQFVEVLLNVEKPDGAADTLRESTKACPPCVADDGWNHVVDQVARVFDAKATKQLGSGDAVGAQRSAEVAAALRPNLPETHLALGKIARAQGNAQGATNEYRKAVEGMPDAKAGVGTTARLELATLLLSSGGGAEAVKLAEQVIAAHEDDPTALDTLGRACDATRDTDCARRAYGKLVKLPAGNQVSAHTLTHARLRVKELKSRRR